MLESTSEAAGMLDIWATSLLSADHLLHQILSFGSATVGAVGASPLPGPRQFAEALLVTRPLLAT